MVGMFQFDLMVKIDLHEICRLGKLTTFINMVNRELVSIVVGEIDEGRDEVKWRMLRSGGIEKEADGGGIRNFEGGGNFLTGDLVGKKSSLDGSN